MNTHPRLPAGMVMLAPDPRDVKHAAEIAQLLSRPVTYFVPEMLPEPILIPDDLIVDDMPTYANTVITNRLIIQGGRQHMSRSIMLATVALLTTTTFRETIHRTVSTLSLQEQVKTLEKALQKHPNRSDLKLQIMQLRTKIRQAELEHKTARDATNRKVNKGKHHVGKKVRKK